MAFAIKAEVCDLRTGTFPFTAQAWPSRSWQATVFRHALMSNTRPTPLSRRPSPRMTLFLKH